MVNYPWLLAQAIVEREDDREAKIYIIDMIE